MSKIYIGMSGWTYEGWRGDFYPEGLVQKKELEYASRQVNSIEINGTFYSLQKPESFQRWHDTVPDDFVFAVKAPQYITHIRRLKEIKEPLERFMKSGLFELKKKLGPILWQFPPNVMLKDDRFEVFLKLLKAYRVRNAFEFRHPSFNKSEFIALMKKHNAAMVLSHAAEKAPYIEEATADFTYARMHGFGKEFKKGYPPKILKEWAARLKKQKNDAYVYFSTDAKEYSPRDAMKLAALLKPAKVKK